VPLRATIEEGSQSTYTEEQVDDAEQQLWLLSSCASSNNPEKNVMSLTHFK
jgi:hypothetical protein